MKALALTISLLISPILGAQNCSITNNAFKAGEDLHWKIQYNWGAIWMDAGEANFKVDYAEINNRAVYHFTGFGATYPKYDWFYKVRDKYESYADTSTLKPLRFKREAYEGGTYTYDDYIFNASKSKVYTVSRRNKKPAKVDSVSITKCTNDVMTAIYYARNLDFSKYKPKDTIPITFVLDGEVFPSYIRYLGKETINSDILGKVRCIKFRPKLIEGTIFKGGEGMTVWVTDDENKIPVYVETPIIVGTVKVKLFKYTNLRNKVDCIIESKTALPK
ncbi:MAG: DUF3108 domain-containing protein [Bacteroidetes bacterium]|nr:DUF3108 domain-containing protein [Bacteroidota bacterium]